MEPKVSVIIPTYNQAEFVRDTLESVLAQTYPNMEIIVTDDGSVDDTPTILREYASRYPDRIVAVTSDRNTGIASNTNRGWKKANGDFVAWLSGDDVMYPTKIEKQVEVLLRRGDAAGCCHDADVFDSRTGQSLGLFSELYNGKRGFREGGVELLFD
ncbi:MAG: glycosyltransferase family 2 protein, partial [Syntrophomonadaceae bacterium]|nr:glycosyltransferase family 2 protein [Syntrophomonadaceae bacterium]